MESPLPFAADEIRGQARVWETVLDEDGTVPAEERAMQARGISAGFTRDGVVHRKMTLLPEIDAKFETLMNAYLNPRSKPTFNDADPDAPKDPRATAQARHDVFASLIDGAARSADSPTIGGAAPTVLVSVRQADLDARHRFRLHRGLRGADLDAGGGAVRLRRWAAACGDRPGWDHQRDRHPGPSVQRHPTAGDQPPRRRLHHPRLLHPGRVE